MRKQRFLRYHETPIIMKNVCTACLKQDSMLIRRIIVPKIGSNELVWRKKTPVVPSLLSPPPFAYSFIVLLVQAAKLEYYSRTNIRTAMVTVPNKTLKKSKRCIAIVKSYKVAD